MLNFRPSASDSGKYYYTAFDENENICGKAEFKLCGYTMDITDVDVASCDAETQEGLIRSALNFGANRNAYIAFFSSEKAVDTALLLGFEKNEDRLCGEIPFLLAGKCCKKD